MVQAILLYLAVTDFAQTPFPLLRLPAEIRNMIYHNLWPRTRSDRKLRRQPAITRVDRQLRAEALPLFLATGISIKIGPNYPGQWVQSMEDVISTFSIQFAASSSTTLHHTTCLALSFRAWQQEDIHIAVEMSNDPENMDPPDHEDQRKSVVIGTPDMIGQMPRLFGLHATRRRGNSERSGKGEDTSLRSKTANVRDLCDIINHSGEVLYQAQR